MDDELAQRLNRIERRLAALSNLGAAAVTLAVGYAVSSQVTSWAGSLFGFIAFVATAAACAIIAKSSGLID